MDSILCGGKFGLWIHGRVDGVIYTHTIYIQLIFFIMLIRTAKGSRSLCCHVY